jgi:hypothetical protein
VCKEIWIIGTPDQVLARARPAPSSDVFAVEAALVPDLRNLNHVAWLDVGEEDSLSAVMLLRLIKPIIIIIIIQGT